MFPSLCSRVEREVIYFNIEDLKENEEKYFAIDGYEEVRKIGVINCEECC